MRVTIVGGGNIGTQFAVHCAEKGHVVTIYTSTPEFYGGYLNIVDENGIVTHEGNIEKATDNPKLAFENADLIMITLPSMMMKKIADVVYEQANEKAIIGVVPGNGGGECAFRKCIERGNVFFGIERVPAIARLVKKGRTVRSVGYRNELRVSALPIANAEYCANLVSDIFDKPCKVIPNYLNLTMTPSNPILHTTRLRTIFSDWHIGVKYERLPLFYEEWDDSSSELLIACDDEVQEICKALPNLRLSSVVPLKVHYESPTVELMTKKISSIQAFKGLTTPAIEIEGGLIPDLHSRYFTADFSYGLTIIKQVAEFAGVKTPRIDETMDWYKVIAVEKDEFRFEDYGIKTKKDFEQFYLL